MPETVSPCRLLQFREMTNVWQASAIRRLAASQILWTVAWHKADPTTLLSSTAIDLDDLVQREHQANFALWHEEDKARDPSADDTRIATVKRVIDVTNQRRNDLVEQIDHWLLQHVVPSATDHPPALHSETPGMMLDRLSILALKIFHTQQEADRADATPLHRARNLDRLTVLQEQRTDLVNALEALLQAVLRGEKSFKLYRQMKMYNDPELNPEVYRKQRG